ncbi:MAG: hypothetical protein GY714_31965 [Desulfobacterales bacterium]|nr:hypothetical protein [Desulfobacterales bacterium]
MSEKKIFKKCSMCSAEWDTRESFLKDSSLKINGYGADFKILKRSLFYFTHLKEGCYSTLVIKAEEFLDLFSGEQYTEQRAGKEECPLYCLDERQLSRCDALCECAFNREIIHIIKNNFRNCNN